VLFSIFFVAKIILDRYLYNMYALYGDVIKETMSVSAPDGIVIRKFNIIMYRHDLFTLAPGQWLNDQVSWQFL